jgi:SAM-dependent methyltransferase
VDQQKKTVSQFGAKAANYLTSAVHATGADLERLKSITGELHPNRTLDLGCGAGHVSFALAHGGARRVTAYDPSAQMLQVVAEAAAARGLERTIETCAGAAEKLPFAKHTFDLIVSRYSAHHCHRCDCAGDPSPGYLSPGHRISARRLPCTQLSSIGVAEYVQECRLR